MDAERFKLRVAAFVQIGALVAFVALLVLEVFVPTADIHWMWLAGLLGIAWGAKPTAFEQLLKLRVVREEGSDDD
jgi:hypothetical protein